MPGLAGTDTGLGRWGIARIHSMVHYTFYKHPEEVGQVEVTEKDMEDTVDVGEDTEGSSILMEHHNEVLKLVIIVIWNRKTELQFKTRKTPHLSIFKLNPIPYLGGGAKTPAFPFFLSNHNRKTQTRLKSKVYNLERLYKFCVKKNFQTKIWV